MKIKFNIDKINFTKLIAAVIICQLAGIIGSIFTVPSVSAWLPTLQKPSFFPPNWLFGPVWILLYTLMGISAYMVWEKGLKNKGAMSALTAFGAQLVLNASWSILFFGIKSPLLGLVCIVVLWLLIVLTILRSHKVSKAAAWLLVPYILWVSFAAILNFEIWRLNG